MGVCKPILVFSLGPKLNKNDFFFFDFALKNDWYQRDRLKVKLLFLIKVFCSKLKRFVIKKDPFFHFTRETKSIELDLKVN